MWGQLCITSVLPITIGRKQKQRCIHVSSEPMANACINAKDRTSPYYGSSDRLFRLHSLLR